MKIIFAKKTPGSFHDRNLRKNAAAWTCWDDAKNLTCSRMSRRAPWFCPIIAVQFDSDRCDWGAYRNISNLKNHFCKDDAWTTIEIWIRSHSSNTSMARKFWHVFALTVRVRGFCPIILIRITLNLERIESGSIVCFSLPGAHSSVSSLSLHWTPVSRNRKLESANVATILRQNFEPECDYNWGTEGVCSKKKI